MNRYIFFLIPIALLFVPQAFGEIERGPNYDRELIATVPGGGETYRWVSVAPRILDNDNTYKDYIFTETDTDLIIESKAGTVSLNKNACGFNFHNGGYIFDNPSPLFSDSITPYSSKADRYSWNEIRQVNNADCEAYFDEANNTLVAKKYAANVAFMEYKYIWFDGSWKTQLEITNLSNSEDTVYGFAQTIDLNRDEIKYGKERKNLDEFDKKSFKRDWLESNENQGKVMSLLNKIIFDFDLGFDTLDSIDVFDTGKKKSKLVFNYLNTNDILLPNDTLIIDPTYSSASPSEDGELIDDDNSNTCDGGTITRDSASTTARVYIFDGLSSDDCSRAYFEWDISSIPNTAVVSDTLFKFEIQGTSASTRNCDYVLLDDQPSVVSDAVLWAAIGSDTVAVDNDPTCKTVSTNNTIDLGSAGDTYAKAQLSSDWFGLGVKADVETIDGTRYRMNFNAVEAASTPDPTLEIVYTIFPAPDGVNDLSSPGETFGSVDLLWTEPNLNTGTLSGYQINYTTPWGDPLTIITNDTGTSDTSTTVTGLNLGTPYSFRVSPWTQGGTNATGNILNVTTQGNFTIGNAVFNQTNSQVIDITFEEDPINATSKFLNVTFANTYDLACDFSYKFANINSTYYPLSSYSVSTTLNETAFQFVDYENEIIDVYCYDTVSGNDAKYLMVQSNFPLLQQIADFRSGEYGTSGDFGVFDFVTLLVVIMSMIGLNRVNESVGVVFNIIFLGSLAYFEIIELPTIVFGLIAVVTVFIITSTRKP